jgi:hypothetical protein
MTTRRSFLLGAASLPLLSVAPKLAASTGEEYDLFAIAGQSNGTGRGDLALSPAVVGGSLECRVPRMLNGVLTGLPHLRALADPVQQTQQQDIIQRGSMWPAFANEYFAATGRNVVICGGCRDGQGLLNAWRLDAPYVTKLTEKVGHAQRLLSETGNTGILRGVIWIGGEQDAKSGISSDLWASEFVRLLQRFRSAFDAPTLPMFCVSLDTWIGYEAGSAAIRTAQQQACMTTAGLALVSQFRDYAGNGGLADAVHWNQPTLNAVGAEAALNVAASLY